MTLADEHIGDKSHNRKLQSALAPSFPQHLFSSVEQVLFDSVTFPSAFLSP